jgi:hypothetical protein
MSIQTRKADGMIRQYCQWCEDGYGHEFNPHGPWLTPTSEHLATSERLERAHNNIHHAPAILKAKVDLGGRAVALDPSSPQAAVESWRRSQGDTP